MTRPAHHSPLTEHQVSAINQLKAAEQAYLLALSQLAPTCNESLTARTLIKTASMWAIRSIADPE